MKATSFGLSCLLKAPKGNRMMQSDNEAANENLRFLLEYKHIKNVVAYLLRKCAGSRLVPPTVRLPGNGCGDIFLKPRTTRDSMHPRPRACSEMRVVPDFDGPAEGSFSKVPVHSLGAERASSENPGQPAIRCTGKGEPAAKCGLSPIFPRWQRPDIDDRPPQPTMRRTHISE